MALRHLYLLASVLWALVLAPIAALMAIAIGAGVTWIFVLGDNPWPNWVEEFLLGLGIVAGLLAAGASFSIVNAFRPRAMDNGSGSPSTRRALILCIVPMVILLVAGLAAWLQTLEHNKAMETADVNEKARLELSAARESMALGVTQDSQGVFHARAQIARIPSG